MGARISKIELFHRPERKRLSRFQAGILIIGKIKPARSIRAVVWLIFSEIEPIESDCVLFASDLNGYEILIAEPVGK